MLAGGPMVLSALLVVAGETRFEVGGRFEASVGQAPTGLTQDAIGAAVPAEQAQVLLVATPMLAFRYLSALDDVQATSSTMVLRRPQPLLDARPLLLESLDVNETGILSKRSRWRLRLNGTYGEQDYTALSQQFVSQPALPSALTVLSINGNGEASWRATRRADLTVQFLGIYRQTLDSQSALSPSEGPGAPGLTFPTQATVSITPGVRQRLSRQTTLEALMAVMDANVSDIPQAGAEPGRLNILSIQPQVGLRQQLGRNHRLHMVAGLNYAAVLRRSEQTHSFPPILPLVQVDLTSVLQRSRDIQWRSTLGAATNAFADPVLGTEVLRGTAQARLDVEMGTTWDIGALAIFATDITGPLQPAGATGTSGAGQLAPDETVLSAEIPFRYRWSDRLLVELGARFAQRAPHLQSPSFAWRSNGREVWLFFSTTTLPRPMQRPSASLQGPSRKDASTPTGPRSTRPTPPPLPSPL
jgi:hypothetical protein